MSLKSFLTKKRVLKCTLTRLREKVETCVEKDDLIEIEFLNNKSTVLSSEFREVFDNIFELCEEDKVDEYVEELQSLQDLIDEINLSVLKLKGKRRCDIHEGNIVDDSASIKLPKLTLPYFSGKIDEWLSFRDFFEASIIKNEKLSAAQKLQYLKGSLRGDAQKLVQSLPITNANFQIAWDLLCERFSNKREIVFALIGKIMSFPPLHLENSTQILNLVDTAKECICSLEVLEQKIENFSETVLVFIVLNKLDGVTRSWWERSLKDDKIPRIDQLFEFLRSHARALQPLQFKNRKSQQISKVTSLTTRVGPICGFCKGDHYIFKCSKFLSLTVQGRQNFVKENHMCFNCLLQNHRSASCKSEKRCKLCSRPHHTLLHFESTSVGSERSSATTNTSYSTTRTWKPESREFVPRATKDDVRCKKEQLTNHFVSPSDYQTQATQASIASCVMDSNNIQQVLLCTAMIKVRNANGKFQLCRALLDPGSQASFISEDCFRKLGLSRKRSKLFISCLGSTGTPTNGIAELVFVPHFKSTPVFSTSVLIINNIIGDLPHCDLNPEPYEFKDLILADPTFCKSGPIDILLGVTISLPMFKDETTTKEVGKPYATRSDLGWIVSGECNYSSVESSCIFANHIQLDVGKLVSKFWELETVPTANMLTKEEQECEEHYRQTFSRDEHGRYTVRLPFRSSSRRLGDSREQALRRFRSIEKKLLSDFKVHDQYKEFMTEYRLLGHMEKVPVTDLHKDPSCTFYLPHHAVMKDSSTTTKMRVVFDASSKTTTGVSLNDILMVGPRIQQELFPVLLRFRTFQIAICADVAKMFRQIKMHADDTDFQRILWRDCPTKPIEEFRLLTVTYGTSSAPFLSTRTLKQLAIDEAKEFPLASAALLRDFYVDDLLSGAHTEGEAAELSRQLIEVMKRGGFILRKWISNAKAIIESIPEELRETALTLSFDHRERLIKVLGIQWNPVSDEFLFSVSGDKQTYSSLTKRDILSDIARIFDPMGLLSPVVIYAKIFIQELWKHDVSWDEPLNEHLTKRWKTFFKDLVNISGLRIPRCVILANPTHCELHAFCDASEKAYCAVIYIRSISNSLVNIQLLTAKTRVAPIKKISLPRLELCGAVLLANLLQAVQQIIEISVQHTFAWTDSTVSLSWISSEPNRWQTFVANRVAQIQDTIPGVQWNYVRGKENPADCATRGMFPSEFVNCELWVHGPSWLKEQFIPNDQHVPTYGEEVLMEQRKSSVSALTQVHERDLILQFSSWTKLCRITAWCSRFIHNCRSKLDQRDKGVLSLAELNKAINIIIRYVQGLHFAEEHNCLSSKKQLRAKSRLLCLSPFLDNEGIIRVGGRLKHADIPEAQKHPILLPKEHYISELIVIHYHVKHLHAGSQLLTTIIRQQFWILGAKGIIRRLVRRCTICCRLRAETAKQIMADLPSVRVLPAKPFLRIGLDFAGPFIIKPVKGRGNKTVKSYVCIFICFSTRAIHLEVVGDLSTKAFIAALKRFIARRGRPSEVFSDCGTNFVGANRELIKTLRDTQLQESVNNFLLSENIKWNFNPPSAPHFGGLWEAGIKSMKFHLKRTMGTSLLTYEEFVTLITQVEACLNSRPLCELSSDPQDLSVLTPGHFLIGTSLTALPEPDLIQERLGHLDRWKLAQKILQHFWKRWSGEYLSRLQQRPKWLQRQRDFQIGELVLVKNENISPLRWKMGRISRIYPGSDGRVRVVDLHCATGNLKRPITKLCALPIDEH